MTRGSAAIVLVFLTSVHARGAGGARFTPLGDLPGGGFHSDVHGISADGRIVVGGSWSTEGGEAYRWSRATGMVGIGDLPGGAFDSEATGASADGSVLVGYSTSSIASAQAFRWTAADGMQTIGSLGASDVTWAWDVSDDGRVIVGQGSSASGVEAFRWTPETGMVGLGDIPGGRFTSIARGVSGDGNVVVGLGHGDSADEVEGFRWTAAGGMQSLGDLPGGHTTTRANATNDDGSVVVGEGSSAAGTEAFRWTASTGMQGLGDLSGGFFASTALAVSGDGNIVTGWSFTENNVAEAFIWDSANGMRSVKSVLELELGLDLLGWRLRTAHISADGLVLAGNGLNPAGASEGWVAQIPEPRAFLWLAALFASLGRVPRIRGRNSR